MNENQHKILISCPISSRAWILPYYLEHIYNIDYNKKLIDIYWIANNIKDNSLELLKEFKNKYENEYNSITIEVVKNIPSFIDKRVTELREKYTYKVLTNLRNKQLNKCVELNCDYLFSCDCDIIIDEDILNNLINTKKDIVSSLIYNGYLFDPNVENLKRKNKVNKAIGIFNKENAYKFPNILKREWNGLYVPIVNNYVKYSYKAPKDKLIECDATGAVCLYSKDVCKNVMFVYHVQGEDIGFAEIARLKGYKSYCLPHSFQYHIMSEKILELYLDGKLNNIK